MDNMYFNPFAQNVAIIKNYFKRKSVLVMAITFLLGVLVSLVTILLSINMLPDMLAQSNNLFRSGYSSSYRYSTSTLSVIYVIAIASFVPIIITGVLKFVSYILIYKKSNNSDPKSNPSAGFTILYVLSIISLVGACVASFFLVIAIFIMFFGLIYAVTSTSYYSSQTSTAALIVLMISCAALIVLMLFAAINELKYFKSIRRSMNSVDISRKGAKPIGVLRIIYIVSLSFYLLMMTISLISMLTSRNAIYYHRSDISNMLPLLILSIILFITYIIYYIFAAKVSLGYSNYIDNIKFGYNGFSAAPLKYTPAQPMPMQATPANSEQPIPNIQQNNFVAQPGEKCFCPQCNNDVKPNDAFCNKCGYKLK